MNKCFECETTEDLQEHHVVPKLRGGTKTVTLCYECHMKAHGRTGKGLNHSRLTKEGLAAAKAKGVKLGNPNPSRSLALCKQSNLQRGQTTIEKYSEIIISLRDSGLSYAKVAKRMNHMGIPTPRGGKWFAASVRQVHQRIKTIKENK